MANKKFYWLKLQHDFFNNKEIKKLRKIAGGDTYVIIYLKLQLLSLKNEGKLYFEGFEDDVASELALDIDEDEENVKVTFMFLKKYGLIEEINNNEFLLPKTVSIIGKEGDSAERVRRFRAKKALQSNIQVTGETLQVTSCNTEREKRKRREREEKEIEKEKSIEAVTDLRPVESTSKNKIDFESIKDTFNKICVTLPKVKSMSDSRKKTIRTWLKSEREVDFVNFFNAVNDSDFLSGRNGKWSGCSFDWIIKPSSRIKIVEGNYTNKNNKKESDMEQLQRLYNEYKEEEQTV